MQSYIVTFTNGRVYQFYADDKDHAIEQANNAEPNLYIDSIVQRKLSLLDIDEDHAASLEYLPHPDCEERYK